MSEFKTYKTTSSSKNNGIGIARSGNRVAVTPISPKNSITSVIESDNLDAGESTSKGSPYNSSVSCGALPSSPSGFNLSEDSPSPSSPSRQISVVAVTPSPVEEEYPCDPEGGSLLVAPSGYYLLKPNYEDRSLSYVQFLGTTIDNPCIIEMVGNVEWLQINGYKSNCTPSRWAYEDGVRKHAIPQDIELWNCMPFVDGTQYDEFFDLYVNDTVSISHYGYNYTGAPGAGANLGGVATAGDVCFFTKNALIAAISETDWEVFDTPCWDFPEFLGLEGSRGVRWIDGFNKNISCGELILDTENPDNRFLQHLNYDRYCTFIIHKVEWSSELRPVCQAYADRMAEYEFISHYDPFDGTDAIERVNNAGIEYTIVSETLAMVTEVVPPEGESEEIHAVSALWEQLKASEVHYDALTSVKYYQVAFGYARAESGAWYGCALVMSQEGDGPDEYESTLVDYPEPPYVWRTEDSDMYPVIYHRGSGVRAVCTAPQEDCYLSGILRSTFEGQFYLFGNFFPVRIKDVYAYDWTCDNVRRNELGAVVWDSEHVDTDSPHEYDKSMLSTGAFIRTMWMSNTNTFWIQRDLRTNILSGNRKDIRVVLEGVRGSSDPDSIPNPGNRDYFRTTPLLKEDEEEPVIIVNGAPGDCELRVGPVYIDRASRLQQGSTINPWQNIMVGSVFYTCSGYTALTYTMPKLLNTTLREWNEPAEDGGRWVKERYWWLKTEYWAAIIDPSGTVIARWKLYAAPPDYSSNDSDSYGKEGKTIEAHGAQEYFVQFEGNLLPEEVKVYCTINGQPFYMEDDGEGLFVEIPNQIDDIEYCLASSEINYHAGSIHFTFGPGYPDEGTEVTILVRVRAEDPLQPIETFQEITQYEGPELFFNPNQISFDGVHVLCPNLTISEDGTLAVFSCRTSWIEFKGASRLGYGDKLQIDSDINFTNKYGTSGLQIQMLDLTNIVGSEPQPLSYPLNIGDSLGDTLILN